MEYLLIEVSTPELKSDIRDYTGVIEDEDTAPILEGLAPQVAQDLCVWYVRHLMLNNKEQEATKFIDQLVFDDSIDEWPRLHHAWLWLVRMSLFIKTNDYMLALGSAENALNVLIDITNKRSEDFLAIIASLLYNLAFVHNMTDDNNRAVKELTKAQKIFERLIKRDNARFSAMLVYSVEASTTIYKNRNNQMNIFAHYQSTTELYTAILNEGGAEKTREALENLVDSLKNEGDLMLAMGNARNAVKFYTKSLRYQKKISERMGNKELELSIALSRALLRLVNRRSAAEQLLNSLLPLAQRLGANKEYAEIQELLNNKTKNFNIMTMLKGLS